MNSVRTKLLDKPYFLWAALFIIAPLVMVLYYAITDKSGAFTINTFAQIPEYFSTILLSILYGLAATVISLLLGYPFAYFLSKHTERAQRTIVLLVMLPMLMNFLIRTYSLMTILGDTGVINSLLSSLHIGKLHLINTPGAVILGMVYNFLP
ncbi:MAG: ABC transporter permease, partial [Eubacterium sp.]|nr:ABC transporter permease [Eubacterium sp.]